MTAPAVVDDFTDREAGLLVECERTIERGLKTFVEVGTALATIRDGRLYRTEYGTFEDYCDQRWSLGRSRAYQLIEAAGVVSKILDAGGPAPAVESQARELARVPEEQRAEVWSEARQRAYGRPTAAVIREVADERKPKPAPSTPDPTFVLKYSASAGCWIVAPLGALPFASDDGGIDALDVAAAQAWAAAQTAYVERREVIRWRESPDTDGAWIAVLDDVRPSATTSPAADPPAAAPAGSRPATTGGQEGSPASSTPGAGEPQHVPAGHDGSAAPTAAPPAADRAAPTSPARGTEEVGEGSPAGAPRPAGEPDRPKPPAWDPAERAAHEADVRRRQDIEAAHQQAKTLVPDVRAHIFTVLAGYRLGEKHLVTRDMIADLRAAVDLLEKEIDGEA